jgi:hypothetical protein
MASRSDLALLEDEETAIDDLAIQNGDFFVVISDQQHIKDTLQASAGWWKQYPEEGVGIRDWVGGPADAQALTKKIRIQLELDGYTVNNPQVTLSASGELLVNPNASLL